MERPLQSVRLFGPFSQPLSSTTAGDVVLLTTTESNMFGQREATQLESVLRNRSDTPINGVEFDSSVDTFAIITGLDAVELDELIELSELAENVIGKSSVEGHSVAFR